MNDERIVFLEGEKSNLETAHTARNFSQHRGSITDSLNSQEYIKWLCKFIDRFAKDNFQFSVVRELPHELRATWTELTGNFEVQKNKPDLKEPLRENYKSVSEWLRQKRARSPRGFLTYEYTENLEINLKRYCNFIGMNPDQIIESANYGTSSPNDCVKKFLDPITTKVTLFTVLKSFYQSNGIRMNLPYPKYQRLVTSCKEISTAQLRSLCNLSDLENKSWILANSYMGLEVGKLILLTVKDFRTDLWNIEKKVYPVKIRVEVSNYYDYTTFIGADAKNVLQQYFRERQFGNDEHPWGFKKGTVLNDVFRKSCKKLGFYEKGKTSPKSLKKRLNNALRESGMMHEWICYVLGDAPYIRFPSNTKINPPLDDELSMAYEKAYPKLRVYEEKI